LQSPKDEYVFTLRFVDGLLGPVGAAVAGLPEAKNFCENPLQDMVVAQMEDAG
jgi:hypothetical protein